MSDEHLFIDTNIVMYAGGSGHKYKEPCARIIRSIADGSFRRNQGTPVTDAEVFQEILYRYALIDKWEVGISMCRDLFVLGLEVRSIGTTEIERTLQLTEIYKDRGIPPRDLVHLAVMLNHGIRKIISVDSHFDLIQEVTRIAPDSVKITS